MREVLCSFLSPELLEIRVQELVVSPLPSAALRLNLFVCLFLCFGWSLELNPGS